MNNTECVTEVTSVEANMEDPALMMETQEVNAVCVDFIDLGVQTTPWGEKRQCKLVFETDMLTETHYPVRVTRTFSYSMYDKSALRIFVSQWKGEDLAAQKAKQFKLASLVGKAGSLKLSDRISTQGYAYLKIEGVAPAKEPKLKPSGTYKRWEPSNN